MSENITISNNIRNELIKLTNKNDTIDAIKELIKGELLRKRNKYMLLDQKFKEQYKMNFENFENGYSAENMKYEIEKDYFDWDMAITILEDIDNELRAL
jgi:hypothetical protein